jgi:uncharacterized glyoxalase superfamily protein PhnB
MTSSQMRKLTPVLLVEAIEPCLPFWVERLGFTKVAEVPEGNTIGFVILVKDDVEIMYQTRASVAADVPAFAHEGEGSETHATTLFIEVSDIAAVERAMKGVTLVLPRRTTFYGMDEIGVREPAGHIVTFAQKVEAAKS